MIKLFTPFFIPTYIGSSDPPPPPRCPECRNIEKTKRVCVHCGYEYKPKPYVPRWYDSGYFIAPTIILAIWVFVTVVVWILNVAMPLDDGKPATLWRCFVAQWEFLKKLMDFVK